ncbi:MAG: hypothetical protein QMD46_04540 [Methanomicrobiales archaeon]|nr:hypothetical protein [Methanomicrobiales archaeon]MDI6876580.1 hypothetical protein [Methanomicrobiales archaeon]
MARELSERDIEILGILAPEVEELISMGAQVEFHNVLPPVSRHFARDEHDFAERLRRLSPAQLEYLAGAIGDGSENLGCMPPEDVEALLDVLREKVSGAAAEKVRAAYGSGGECG